LEAFSPLLVDKPRLILGTKLDLEGTSERLEELRTRYPDEQLIGVSVFSGEGLDAVSEAFSGMVNELDVAEASRK
jgi:GTP-binding protein